LFGESSIHSMTTVDLIPYKTRETCREKWIGVAFPQDLSRPLGPQNFHGTDLLLDFIHRLQSSFIYGFRDEIQNCFMNDFSRLSGACSDPRSGTSFHK
jgi:hypothetical protein